MRRIQILFTSKPLVNAKQAYSEDMFSFSYNSFLRYIELLGYSQQHATKTLLKNTKLKRLHFAQTTIHQSNLPEISIFTG